MNLLATNAWLIILSALSMSVSWGCDDSISSDGGALIAGGGSEQRGGASGGSEGGGGYGSSGTDSMGGTLSGGGRIGGEIAEGGVQGGDSSGGAGVTEGTWVRLELTPRRALLTLIEDAPPPVQVFEVYGVTGSGARESLDLSVLSWTLSPESLGEIEEGVFTSAGASGAGIVAAEYQHSSGGAPLTVTADVKVFRSQDLLLDGLEADVFQRFDEAPLDEQCTPLTLIYPEHETVIPSNLFGLSFQWRQTSAPPPILITARSGGVQVRWVTTQHQLTPDGLQWESLKLSDSTGEMRFNLSHLTSSGARCDGPPISVIADPSELVGAVYYWSTGDMGIMRLAAGETAPEPLLTPGTAPTINCPACHALSRDGSRIAFTRTTFPPFGDLATSNILQPTTLLYDPMGVEGYFPSFSPDPNRLVAGSSGQLVIRDSNTGALIEQLSRPPMTVGGSPDWSWQGDRIVAVLGPEGLVNLIPNASISEGSLYEWTFVDDQWSTTPTMIVGKEGDTWITRPAYSPDGQYIAYNVEGNDTNAGGESMGNRNVDLFIKRVGDGSAPIRLDAANGGELLGNSWPKWSPNDRRGRMWLAFSSFRDYGHTLVNSGRESPTPQIWVTSIDPNAPPGIDPSAPGFWLPFQDINSGNHIPYWAAYEKR
jgi:hypothetical protein